MLFLLFGKTINIKTLNFQDVKQDLALIQNLLRNTEKKEVNDNYLQSFHSKLKELMNKYNSDNIVIK